MATQTYTTPDSPATFSLTGKTVTRIQVWGGGADGTNAGEGGGGGAYAEVSSPDLSGVNDLWVNIQSLNEGSSGGVVRETDGSGDVVCQAVSADTENRPSGGFSGSCTGDIVSSGGAGREANGNDGGGGGAAGSEEGDGATGGAGSGSGTGGTGGVGASGAGSGGAGGGNTANGVNATAPGGGGGGSVGGTPGTGADGKVIITYTEASPEIAADPTTLNLGTAAQGSSGTAQTSAISGTALTDDITATAITGTEVSTDGNTYGPTATFTQVAGSASGTLYVRIKSDAVGGAIAGNIALTSTGAATVNIALSGVVAVKGSGSSSTTGATGLGTATGEGVVGYFGYYIDNRPMIVGFGGGG